MIGVSPNRASTALSSIRYLGWWVRPRVPDYVPYDLDRPLVDSITSLFRTRKIARVAGSVHRSVTYIVYEYYLTALFKPCSVLIVAFPCRALDLQDHV